MNWGDLRRERVKWSNSKHPSFFALIKIIKSWSKKKVEKLHHQSGVIDSWLIINNSWIVSSKQEKIVNLHFYTQSSYHSGMGKQKSFLERRSLNSLTNTEKKPEEVHGSFCMKTLAICYLKLRNEKDFITWCTFQSQSPKSSSKSRNPKIQMTKTTYTKERN